MKRRDLLKGMAVAPVVTIAPVAAAAEEARTGLTETEHQMLEDIWRRLDLDPTTPNVYTADAIENDKFILTRNTHNQIIEVRREEKK